MIRNYLISSQYSMNIVFIVEMGELIFSLTRRLTPQADNRDVNILSPRVQPEVLIDD